MTGDVEAEQPLLSPTRRAVLAGAGAAAVVVLTGCSTYDSSGGSRPAAAAGAGATQPPAPSGAAPAPIAKTADVPVGGGVVTSHGVVVTQPTAGDFRGFSNVCTHQGCTVARVENRLIVCACHGSRFRIEDGTVAQGPAVAKLADIPVVVSGAEIVRPGRSS